MLLLAVNICRFCTLPHNNRSFLASPEQRASYSNHHGEIQTQHCHFWNRKALGWGMFTSFWLCSKCTIRLKCRMQNNFHHEVCQWECSPWKFGYIDIELHEAADLASCTKAGVVSLFKLSYELHQDAEFLENIWSLFSLSWLIESEDSFPMET